MDLTSNFHEQVGNEGTNRVTHGHTIDLFIMLTLEEEVSVSEAKLQLGDYLGVDMDVLCGRKGLGIACFLLCW